MVLGSRPLFPRLPVPPRQPQGIPRRCTTCHRSRSMQSLAVPNATGSGGCSSIGKGRLLQQPDVRATINRIRPTEAHEADAKHARGADPENLGAVRRQSSDGMRAKQHGDDASSGPILESDQGCTRRGGRSEDDGRMHHLHGQRIHNTGGHGEIHPGFWERSYMTPEEVTLANIALIARLEMPKQARPRYVRR